MYTIICAGRQIDRQTNILKNTIRKLSRGRRHEGSARTLPPKRAGEGVGGERLRQGGSARIFMAWRRSNLIKVPARQHLECESALATEEGQGE